MFKQLKKRSWVAGTLGLALALTVTACGGSGGSGTGSTAQPNTEAPKPAPAEKTITLKIANIYPVKHVVHEKGYAVMQQLIEERSEGRIKIEMYPTEQLGSAFDMVDLVANGVTDVGSIVPAYWPDKFPVSQAFGLPAIYQDNWTGVQAMWNSLHEGPIHDELAAADLYPLMLEAAPITEWVTANKKIEKVSDIAGLKIRSTGGIMDQSLTNAGAVPVQLPLAQVYEGLDRGTIDGVSMNYSLASGFSINEVGKYMTSGGGLFPIGISIAAMSAEKFNALPEDVQQIIYEAGKEATLSLAAAFFADNEEKKKKFAEEGVTIVELPSSFIEEMKVIVQPAYESYKDVLTSRGMDGAAVLETIQKTIDEAGKVSDKKVLKDFTPGQ